MMSECPERPNYTAQNAVQIARELYGISATAYELPSERDRNFHLHTDSGKRFVLKIANAAEDRANLDFQNQAMEHIIRRTGLALCPGVIPSSAGDTILTIEAPASSTHLARLLTYLPGEPLGNIRFHPPELLESLGHVLGMIDDALVDFDHPAAHREFYWDLKRAGSTIRKYIKHIDDSAHRSLVEHHLSEFETNVNPVLPHLRSSVIHNDGNDYNVLVAGAKINGGGITSKRVTGIIDFGDAVYSTTVNEVAVAAAYAMLDKPDPLVAAADVVRGYHAVHPLTELELEHLFTLSCIRLCLSVTIAAYQQQQEPYNDYLRISEKPAWQLLHKLIKVHPRLAHYTFRHACGLPPCPHREIIVDHLIRHRNDFGPLIIPDVRKANTIVFDLSVGSPDLGVMTDLGDLQAVSAMVFERMRAAGAEVGIGRYDEARSFYSGDQFTCQGNQGVERRTIHLGVDVFMPAGTPVFAPLDGVIHSFNDNSAKFDSGPTIIIQHKTDDGEYTFFTSYGHLSRDSLDDCRPGLPVKKGDGIGRIGNYTENGHWPPHVHFQIIVDLLGHQGGFPGVCRLRQREIWRSINPDPNSILGIREECSPAIGETRDELIKDRNRFLGRALSISYHRPLKIVRGWMQYLYDENGRDYLDAVNNVPHVGHCHPRVVRAAQRQMAVLNTNTRYLHDCLVQYARRLCALMPDPLSVCYFMCTGSEANELALRLARTHTRRTDVIVVDGAYHGNTSSLIELSPYKFDGPGGLGAPPHVHKVVMPDGYRGRYRYGESDLGGKYAGHVRQAVEEIQHHNRGLAAFFCESLLGCGGQIILPEGYLREAYRHVREAGGVCVADEVQVGFGRMGSHFWGFGTQGVAPDIVTLGKPMGNGHPLAAVITTPEIAESFETGMEYFNTYGGNPVSCAAGMAVLDVIEEENLQANARNVGAHLKSELQRLKNDYPLIGDVRGWGLFIGIELVLNRETRAPAKAHADYVAERMKERGILISTDGPDENVLKIKPPLVFSEANADMLVRTLAEILYDMAEDYQAPSYA